MGNSSRKKIIFLCIAILSVIGYGVLVFAAPPSGGYTPGAILDPECAPNTPDCQVTLPAGGSSQWDDVLGGINYAGGNVGIGTTTPSAALDVVGTIQGSNLNITGNGVTVSAPTNLTASFIYDNGAGYNYGAYGYARNYRIYSYKDTVQGRAYSSSYLTLSMPVGSVPAAPTNLTANQTCADGCNYYANGSVTHNFRVYAYKTINDQRIYSTSYATLGSDFTDDNSNANYDITLSWDPVAGADGYRILKFDQGYNGFNYDVGFDTVSTSIIDDGCGNVCFNNSRSSVITTSDIYDNGSTDSYGVQLLWDPVPDADGYRIIIYDPAYNGYIYDAGYDTTSTSIIDDACGSICFDGNSSAIDVGQTTAYTNVATINGQLTLTGPIVLNNTTLTVKQNNFGWNTDVSNLSGNNNIFLGSDAGYGATNASYSNFLGYEAGQGATNAYDSNFFGSNAGQGATSAYQSNFFGDNAGSGATNASFSNFLGQIAGYGAANAYSSNFLGQNAGYYATSANNSNFFGTSAGNGATNASDSNFLGYQAGYGATNAYYSNFLGQNAGQGATYAHYSNFLGYQAGQNATSANNSNFLGHYAGYNATSASNSNFIGRNAGYGATNADIANFIGYSAGQNATGANFSNFIGFSAGISATNASDSNFFGRSAGQGATNASNSNFIGNQAGLNASGAFFSNFIGRFAGQSATSAVNSNFLGTSAGNGATGANNANFLGQNAGKDASGAAESNFLGNSAGLGATGASRSNFLGSQVGQNATNAFNSNFLGYYAGYNATNAYNSNFFGASAGQNATSASLSNFFGYRAGDGATNASNSNFLGYYAGSGATNASYSNFLGVNAGYNATSASNSNFFGWSAGYQATNANNSNFLGNSAGSGAAGAYNSNFLGYQAGQGATNAEHANFFGANAGYGATGASQSNFFGRDAGNGATAAYSSNFFGDNAGTGAVNAAGSTFFGKLTGAGATNAYSSNFFGDNAGYLAINASNSIFIGQKSGLSDKVNNTGNVDDFSILIGPNTSTGDNGSGVGYSNSIAIGAYATNTASNQFMIGSATRTINEVVIVGSGTSCTIDNNIYGSGSTGLNCSSDERLKTNIEDLESTTLDTLLNVKTVRYNWNANPTGNKSIGFLAQDLQQYFPELVKTGHDGYLQVNYGGITPILVEAIREMNLNITQIADMTKTNTWREALIAWFGNMENGITDLYAKIIHTDRVETKELCVGSVCVTEDQFLQVMNQSGQSEIIIQIDQPVVDDSTPVINDNPENTDDGSVETTETDQPANMDPVPENNISTEEIPVQ